MKNLSIILITIMVSTSTFALTATCAVADIANDYFNRSDCEYSRRIPGSVSVGGERGSSVEFKCGGEIKLLVLRRGGYSCTANQVLMDLSQVANEAAGWVGTNSSGGIN